MKEDYRMISRSTLVWLLLLALLVRVLVLVVRPPTAVASVGGTDDRQRLFRLGAVDKTSGDPKDSIVKEPR